MFLQFTIEEIKDNLDTSIGQFDVPSHDKLSHAFIELHDMICILMKNNALKSIVILSKNKDEHYKRKIEKRKEKLASTS